MAEEVSTPPAETTEEATPAVSGKPAMAAKVYAPFQVYFEGDAYSVSAINATGPFDVLPGHKNFLCMLVPCSLTVQAVKDNATKTIKIHRALMHVKADSVDVFMDV